MNIFLDKKKLQKFRMCVVCVYVHLFDCNLSRQF